MTKTLNKSTRKPTQKRAQETWQAILTAAARVLDREGFEAASTNRIAEIAGVGIGSLYQYFRNKDQIIMSLLQRLLDDKLAVMRTSLETHSPTNLREGVQALVRTMIHSKSANARFERILESQISRMGIGLKVVEKADLAVIQMLKEFLEPYRDEIDAKDLDFSLFVVIQAFRGAMIFINQSRPEYLRSPKLEQMLTDMIYAGLRSR